MSPSLAQVVVPAEGMDSSLLQPLYLLLALYLVMFLVARVLEGRDDDRAEPVTDAGFALLLLAGVYALVLLVMALFSQFDLIVDMVEIMAIIIGFMAILVTVLLGVELLIGLGGRRKRRGAEVPPPETSD